MIATGVRGGSITLSDRRPRFAEPRHVPSPECRSGRHPANSTTLQQPASSRVELRPGTTSIATSFLERRRKSNVRCGLSMPQNGLQNRHSPVRTPRLIPLPPDVGRGGRFPWTLGELTDYRISGSGGHKTQSPSRWLANGPVEAIQSAASRGLSGVGRPSSSSRSTPTE